MRELNDIIQNLPAARRATINARAQKLIMEEKALRRLREALNLTQTTMADLLGIDQAGVSKIERRSDMLISTMRNYVEAMGGSLQLIAKFPDGSVELNKLEDMSEAMKPQRKPRAKKPKPSSMAPA